MNVVEAKVLHQTILANILRILAEQAQPMSMAEFMVFMPREVTGVRNTVVKAIKKLDERGDLAVQGWAFERKGNSYLLYRPTGTTMAPPAFSA